MGRKGTFYFFTGLAGAGKSTIGGLFYQALKKQRNDVLLFDGDVVRVARQEKPDYSNEARLESCRRSMGMYKLITDQGIDVVCCAIAMFEEVREWYRTNLENYREIYIKVPMEVLYQRDQKGLYSSGAKQVVGVDLPYEEPQNPDILIKNDGAETPEEIVHRLLLSFGLSGNKIGLEYDAMDEK